MTLFRQGVARALPHGTPTRRLRFPVTASLTCLAAFGMGCEPSHTVPQAPGLESLVRWEAKNTPLMEIPPSGHGYALSDIRDVVYAGSHYWVSNRAGSELLVFDSGGGFEAGRPSLDFGLGESIRMLSTCGGDSVFVAGTEAYHLLPASLSLSGVMPRGRSLRAPNLRVKGISKDCGRLLMVSRNITYPPSCHFPRG